MGKSKKTSLKMNENPSCSGPLLWQVPTSLADLLMFPLACAGLNLSTHAQDYLLVYTCCRMCISCKFICIVSKFVCVHMSV